MASISIPTLLATPGTPLPRSAGLASLGRDPLLHATVRKAFGSQWFFGKVMAVDMDPQKGERAYHVVYDDGDDEHMQEGEVRRWLGETCPGAMACAGPQARAPRGVSPLRYPAEAAPARRPSLVPGRTLPREQCHEHAQPGKPPAQIGALQVCAVAALLLAGVWGVALLWNHTTAADVDPIADFGALEWHRHTALGVRHADARPEDMQAYATHGTKEHVLAKPASQSVSEEILQHVAQAQDSSSSKLSPKTASAVPSPAPLRDSDTSAVSSPAPPQVSDAGAPDKDHAAETVANISGLLMVVLGFALFWKPVQRDPTVIGVADPACSPVLSTSPLPCAPNPTDVPIPLQRLEQPGAKALRHEPSVLNGGKVPDHTSSFFERKGGTADAVLHGIHIQDENDPLAANAMPGKMSRKRRARSDGPCEKMPRRDEEPREQAAPQPAVSKNDGIRNRLLLPPGEGRFRHTVALRKLEEMGFSDTPDLRCVLAGNQGNVGATLRDMGLA